MKVTAKITGFDQVTKNVAKLQARLTRGAMREALTKSGRLVTANAKAGAPVGRTGLLKKSIKMRVKTNVRKNSVTARIGASVGVKGTNPLTGKPQIPAKYLHLVEFGTAARGVYGKKGKKVTPGNPPRPFMRQAFESTKGEAQSKYFAEMKTAISNEANRIYKSSQRARK